MFNKNKKRQGRRDSGMLQNRQQSYHYSAKRSDADKIFGRRESVNSEDQKQSPVYNMYRRHKLYVAGAAALLILCIAYFSTLTSTVEMNTISNSDFAADKSMMQTEISNLVNGTVFNRSKVTLNETKLENQITEKFPGVSRVDVNTGFFSRRINVALLFSKPSILLTNGSKLYIVSENGTVLMDVTKTKPGFDTSKLPLVQDQTGVTLEINKPALTEQQAAFIREVKFQTESKGLSVETMILASGGGQMDVRYGGLTYFVKFNLFENARKSSGTFLAVKEELESKKKVPQEYIDVRIPERAYVK